MTPFKTHIRIPPEDSVLVLSGNLATEESRARLLAPGERIRYRDKDWTVSIKDRDFSVIDKAVQ